MQKKYIKHIGTFRTFTTDEFKLIKVTHEYIMKKAFNKSHKVIFHFVSGYLYLSRYSWLQIPEEGSVKSSRDVQIYRFDTS